MTHTDVERGWCPVGFHHLPQGPIENVVLLMQKDDEYRTAVISEVDLPSMIRHGILLEVREDSQFCYPYIKIPEDSS